MTDGEETISLMVESCDYTLRCAHADCGWHVYSEDIVLDDSDFIGELIEEHVAQEGHVDYAADVEIAMPDLGVERTVTKEFEIEG